MRNSIPLWQQEFLNEYLINGQNAVQAYLKVRPNCKTNSAAVNAIRLLRNAKFKAFLDVELAKSSKKIEMSREEWLRGLAQIARFDLRNYFQKVGDDLQVTEDWDKKADGHVIESIKAQTTTSEEGQVFHKLEFKAASKIAAYQTLGKALGYLDERVEHNHTGQIDHNLKLSQENISRLTELRKRFPLPSLGFPSI